jgi:hypothetical protein
VYEDNRPSSHRITRITATVSSIVATPNMMS